LSGEEIAEWANVKPKRPIDLSPITLEEQEKVTAFRQAKISGHFSPVIFPDKRRR